MFRVEHKTRVDYNPHIPNTPGLGPYNSGSRALRHLLYRHASRRSTPPLHLDSKLKHLGYPSENKHLYYGFPDPRALFTWFNERDIIIALRRRDYVIRKYRGSVTHGEYQSVLDTDAPWVKEDTNLSLTWTCKKRFVPENTENQWSDYEAR